MAERQSRSDAVREWLIRVESDLGAAEVLRQGRLFEGAAFHCQQAAEKATKGLLTWHDIPFPKTHLLRELQALVATADGAFASLVSSADFLSEYAWEFRYPGTTQEATEALVVEALSMARRVYEAVLTRVPKEAHPTHGDHQ